MSQDKPVRDIRRGYQFVGQVDKIINQQLAPSFNSADTALSNSVASRIPATSAVCVNDIMRTIEIEYQSGQLNYVDQPHIGTSPSSGVQYPMTIRTVIPSDYALEDGDQ